MVYISKQLHAKQMTLNAGPQPVPLLFLCCNKAEWRRNVSNGEHLPCPGRAAGQPGRSAGTHPLCVFRADSGGLRCFSGGCGRPAPQHAVIKVNRLHWTHKGSLFKERNNLHLNLCSAMLYLCFGADLLVFMAWGNFYWCYWHYYYYYFILPYLLLNHVVLSLCNSPTSRSVWL